MKSSNNVYWIAILFPVPEVIFLLMFPLVFFVFDHEITILMRDIIPLKIPSDMLSKIAWIPLAIIPASAYFFSGILSPDHNDVKALHNGPDLWALRMTCISGLVYQGLFAGISLVSLAACKPPNVECSEFAIFLATLGTAWSSLTLLNAKARVQELLSSEASEQP